MEDDVISPGPSAQPAEPAEAELTAGPTPPPPKDVPIHVRPDCPDTSPASTEVEGEFTVVSKPRSQKRKLKASKSLANPPKKASVAAPSASASAKVKPNPPPPTPAPSTEEPSDSPMEESLKERVPPLYVREKSKWEKLVPMLDRSNVSFVHARSTAVGIRVQCPDSDNHRRLTALLRSESIGFHTYALQDERVIRAVIRGLPREIDPAMVKEDLLAKGFPVQQVHRMYHSRSKHPFDMVLVVLDFNDEGKKIFDLRSVCRLSGLKIEDPKGRGKIGQCHNCQVYGHSARNCFAQSRCVKCLGNHSTADCSRKQPTEEPPSCVLCGAQGHPANYRGCPKAPKEPRRRVKPAGESAPPPPKPQRFVPAPAPTTNAWHKPLSRAAPAHPKAAPAHTRAGPATSRAAPAHTRAGPAHSPAAKLAPGRAVPPSPAPVSRPAPIPKAAASVAATSPASSSFSANWNYVSAVIDSIDLEQVDSFVAKAKVNLAEAILEHSELLTAIKACNKTLNG